MHPQPAEVYCTQVIRQRMEDSAAALVFTGSSDCGIRLWTSTLSSQDIGLLGDKIHHERSVVSLCLDNQTKRLFSGDAGGVILVWGCRRRDVIRSGTDFVVLRTIDNLNGVKSWPITGLCLNRTVLSDGVRHLLSLTPNGIKMIDLSTYQLSPVTFEENDLRFMMKGAAFIEGGRFIVGGTSEGRVQVWDSICGQHIAVSYLLYRLIFVSNAKIISRTQID